MQSQVWRYFKVFIITHLWAPCSWCPGPCFSERSPLHIPPCRCLSSVTPPGWEGLSPYGQQPGYTLTTDRESRGEDLNFVLFFHCSKQFTSDIFIKDLCFMLLISPPNTFNLISLFFLLFSLCSRVILHTCPYSRMRGVTCNVSNPAILLHRCCSGSVTTTMLA